MKIKQFFNRIKQSFPEIFILLGTIFILYATFLISNLIGLYLTGAIIITLGLLFAKRRG